MGNLPIGFVVVLLSLSVQCRGSGADDKGAKANPAAKAAVKKLDSTVATIRVESVKDGYRFFLQPKDKGAKMESRCLSWSLVGLEGSKQVSSLDFNEDVCNDESYKLEGQEVFIRLVDKDSSKIAKRYGEDYVQLLSSAQNPVLFLEKIEYQEAFHRFIEVPLGESAATLTFNSNDSCENRSDVNEGCEKKHLPPPTIGQIHLKIKMNIKEGQFEIR